MTTPIYDFLNSYVKSDFSRLHMPGHKGKSIFDVFSSTPTESPFAVLNSFDITEITGADELYNPTGIILESEQNTASFYGSKHTSFSASGSTLCIQAMLSLVAGAGDTIIYARNVHTSFVNTCGLLDINPVFIMPNCSDDFFVSFRVSAEMVEQAIEKSPDAKAVYITSPDYLGGVSDIGAIAKVCDKYSIPLVVDNAHGAYLKSLADDAHPISLGATMCCDSAHKTLPVLTGGAYLHVSKKSDITKGQVKSHMALFGSTSPSYLILCSLDLNNKYLEELSRSDYTRLKIRVSQLKTLANKMGFSSIESYEDITKLTFNAFEVGLSGQELEKHFNKFFIEPEYTSNKHVVLMLSPFNSQRDFDRVIGAIKAISPKPKISENVQAMCVPKQSMSIKKALFCESEEIDIESAVGRVSAEIKIKCPPGVPIVIPGEIIDKSVQILLKKSSILTINVIK